MSTLVGCPLSEDLVGREGEEEEKRRRGGEEEGKRRRRGGGEGKRKKGITDMWVTDFMQQVARHTHVDRSATSVRKVKKEDGLQIKGTSLPLQSLLRIW